MKKGISIVLVLSLVLSMLISIPVTAVGGPYRVVVNGKRVDFPDALPYVDSAGRMQVPVRFVSEALGGKVGWEASTQTVTITRGSDTVVLQIGKNEIQVNGVTKEMETTAVLRETRTFVPIRFVSEGLGAVVTWDESIDTAYIDILLTGELVNRAGYMVPDNTDVGVGISGIEGFDSSLDISILKPNYEQQVSDLYTAIKSRFGEAVAREIDNHIKPKKARWDKLPEKVIYIKETDQFIWLPSTGSSTIEIYVTKPGVNYHNWPK